jgi:Spy/CpxP family protein refolding chaperone
MVHNINTSKILAGAIVALCLGFAQPILAQDAPPPHKRDREEIKARILEKVLEVKHQKIREVLVLDDETAKKFFAQYDPAEKDMLEIVKQKQEQELKLLQLTQGDYKDADVDPTLDKIKDLNQKIQKRYEQLDNNLKSVLNPRQRAKLMVFEKEFNQRVREKVKDRIEKWKEKHPGERPFKGKRPEPPIRPNKK